MGAPPVARRPLRIATRGSALARAQAEAVAARLGGAELVIVSTGGDRDTTTPIHTMGGVGIFAKEVQDALLEGRADVAVHSAKDLPAITPPGLVLAAVPERVDPRDALVGARLTDLPDGATVATGAVRRRAQLAAARPDLRFADLRGNIGTRLERARDFDAIVVAVAGLERLGLADRIAEILDPTVMLPQVGQGALALECRADDDTTRAALDAIDDRLAHRCVRAERAFLAELGGGCTLPCGALAWIDGAGVTILALLAAPDGRRVVRARATDVDPVHAGIQVARAILDDQGGRALLEPDTASGATR
jgi:hydroxymethylbilane synthase